MQANYQLKEETLKDSMRGLARSINHIVENLKDVNEKIDRLEASQNIIVDKLSKKPEYLSVGEVVLIEGVCEKTIRNRIKEGAIPATKNEGERSYKISALQYYETRTEVKSKNSSRNVS